MYIRAKRVSGPLDDKVKARLRGDGVLTPTGYASSGSDHEALFSGPIHAFLDIDHHDHDSDSSVSDDVHNEGAGSGVGGDGDSCDAAAGKAIHGILLERSRRSDSDSDPFLVKLHCDVMAAVSAEGMKRSVMARLRECGYNAGICKARWESSGSSLSAGSYEYIDIVVEEKEEESRYIVDVEFAAEFTVARPTEEYTKLAAALPTVMVGRGEDVRQVVTIMAEAAIRSMKRRGLSVPPWRKRRYMLAKWFGPYRRTTNALRAPPAAGEMMKCRRAAGFAVAGPASASTSTSERILLP